jgi:hypothetical protein
VGVYRIISATRVDDPGLRALGFSGSRKERRDIREIR